MTFKCIHCGIEKKLKPSLSKKQKFCSRKCQKKYYLRDCAMCGKKFRPDRLSRYTENTTCSRKCYYKFRKILSGQEVTCHQCGRKFRKPNSLIKDRNFCDKRCWLEFWTDSDGWLTDYGYKYISVNGLQILEHRYVMEQFLNRPLQDNEVVHHKNGNRLDNKIENLELMTRSNHSTHHNIERAKQGFYRNPDYRKKLSEAQIHFNNKKSHG